VDSQILNRFVTDLTKLPFLNPEPSLEGLKNTRQFVFASIMILQQDHTAMEAIISWTGEQTLI
jgi:hypothetical protein